MLNSLPAFLKSYDDLEAHIDEAFKDLTTVERAAGSRRSRPS